MATIRPEDEAFAFSLTFGDEGVGQGWRAPVREDEAIGFTPVSGPAVPATDLPTFRSQTTRIHPAWWIALVLAVVILFGKK